MLVIQGLTLTFEGIEPSLRAIWHAHGLLRVNFIFLTVGGGPVDLYQHQLNIYHALNIKHNKDDPLNLPLKVPEKKAISWVFIRGRQI